MVIGTVELLKLVKENNLVENLDERELTNPEGAGFDFRINRIYRILGEEGFIGLKERSTPKVEEIPPIDNKFTLNPGDYVIVETMEKVNLPGNVVAIPRVRTTLFRSGIIFNSTQVAPGYSGVLSFALFNAGGKKFIIERGARFCHLLFLRTGENVSTYRGQWQGGRISTEGKKEVQV